MSRTIAIGDIHGCLAALEAVLGAIVPRLDDTIVVLGDVIDRGPDSRGVIERLLQLKTECRLVPLMGNHEFMLFNAAESDAEFLFWSRFGGKQTIDSYGEGLDDIPPAHWDFLRNLLPYWETNDYFFVHANYAADVPLSEQPDYLRYWEHLNPEALPPPHESGKIAIVGHTAQRSGEIIDGGHVICLDTCCHGGGWLTAMDVHSRRMWQANRHGELRSDA